MSAQVSCGQSVQSAALSTTVCQLVSLNWHDNRSIVKMLLLDYDINVIWAILIFFTLFMIIYNGVISIGENHLPAFIIELFRYGKTLDGPAKTPIIKLISVPKSYFTHFYIFSSIYVPGILINVLYYYINNIKVSDDVTNTLDILCTTDRQEATTSTRLVLVMSLLTLQVRITIKKNLWPDF